MFVGGMRICITELLYLAQFRIQSLHDCADIQFEQSGVGADKSTHINWRGKNNEVALLQGAQVIAANFGYLSDLLDREALGLAGLAKLFGNRRHSSVYTESRWLSSRTDQSDQSHQSDHRRKPDSRFGVITPARRDLTASTRNNVPRRSRKRNVGRANCGAARQCCAWSGRRA